MRDEGSEVSAERPGSENHIILIPLISHFSSFMSHTSPRISHLSSLVLSSLLLSSLVSHLSSLVPHLSPLISHLLKSGEGDAGWGGAGCEVGVGPGIGPGAGLVLAKWRDRF